MLFTLVLLPDDDDDDESEVEDEDVEDGARRARAPSSPALKISR